MTQLQDTILIIGVLLATIQILLLLYRGPFHGGDGVIDCGLIFATILYTSMFTGKPYVFIPVFIGIWLLTKIFPMEQYDK